MKKTLSTALLVLSLCVLAPTAHAAPLSFCASDFSSCTIFEDGSPLSLPGLAISGDVVLLDKWTGTVSDVFRIFNDIVDTGGGTGLGITAFLFSEDLGDLPDPSTFSANAAFINENTGNGVGTIETDFNGNGTIYRIISKDDGSPEPSTFVLMGLGAAVVLWRRRRTPQIRA
jgi:PEP-CTERM motif